MVRFFSWLIVVTALFVATGCQGGSNSPPPFFPTPTPLLGHLYVGNDNTPGGILQYTLPITAGQTPSFTISSNNNVADALDPSSNLAAGDNAGHLTYFTAPFSAASVPAASFNNGAASNDGQIAFTTAGVMYVTTVSNRVNAFTPPFSNASAPSSFIINGALAAAIGVGFDAAQNLYISNAGTGSNLFVYAPPYTGVPIITPAIAGVNYRKLAIGGSQLFVCNVNAGAGFVDVYNLPLTNASAPAFSIRSGINGPEAVALDSAGMLYVGNLNNASVTVYTPPFSAASSPTTILIVSAGAFAIFGIAIGP